MAFAVYETAVSQVYILAEDTEVVSRKILKRGSLLVSDGKGGWNSYENAYAALRGMAYVTSYYNLKRGSAYLSLDALSVALTLAWDLDLGEGQGERLEAYRVQLERVRAAFVSYKDARLAEAADRAEWAKEVEDVLGRWNPMSRASIICAAVRRVDAWVDLSDILVEGVDTRRLAILAVIDQAWGVRNEVLKDLVEIHGHWWHPERIGRLTRRQATKLARRLAVNREKLSRVVVAPFGTHAFPRAIEDLTEATKILAGTPPGNWKADVECAGQYLDRTRRALELLEAHRHLEQIRATVGVLNRFKLTPSENDVLSIKASLATVLAILSATSDDGFRNPIVKEVTSCVQRIIRDLEGEMGTDFWGRIHNSFLLACRPF